MIIIDILEVVQRVFPIESLSVNLKVLFFNKLFITIHHCLTEKAELPRIKEHVPRFENEPYKLYQSTVSVFS